MPDAIRAAAAAGFGAVECHFPFDFPPAVLRFALADSGIPMLVLNTRPGDPVAGDFGVCAVPGREDEAQAAIDEAIAYASAIKCQAVHVMAGKTDGSAKAERSFRRNLDHACAHGAGAGLRILIEPINTIDVPGYHLSSMDRAADIVKALGHNNLRILADCYHLQRMGVDPVSEIRRHLPLIGHIQIAAAPDRGEPDRGEIDYRVVAAALRDMGYGGYLGAEYRPRGTTEDGLGWMTIFRSGRP
ncbi:hydroxypyruvate isomerase family protein [Oricola cellulosilytica]|uniref:hydroxypyruvate isomerase family protein n=1 Tax=Oricola cellulosilytica TaxID=1429082 RepID=UPI001CBB108C|nr:TIM barrel protein [Oricola cellulosilytica]